MYILGISSYYHDSAAVLIKDGRVVYAIEEERFTRIKHDNNFPDAAIKWCLKEANITINDVDYISYYEKPLLKFERVLDMFIQTWPKSLVSFVKNMPELLGEKLNIENTIRTKLGYKGIIIFTHHHLSHAAAAFYSSPFASSAILTIDGVGEYQTTALWKADKRGIRLIKELQFPHSLGLFYSTCAAYLGFKVNEDEYKLMGLAAYGRPAFLKKLEKIITVKQDGSFHLNMDYFSFRESPQMWSKKLEKMLGPARKPNEKITKKHADIAKSVQTLTEHIYIRILNHFFEITHEENVCISGGVALNALANGLIHKQTPFKKSHVFGPAGDSGAALGSALFTYYDKMGVSKKTPITDLSLGSSHPDSAVEIVLKKRQLNFVKMTQTQLINDAASSLNDGKIIGWFQGKCELGPRALGNRSILCRPSPRLMKAKVNIIKIREQFRPFAGSILQSEVHNYFEVPENNHLSPYMNFCFIVKREKRKDLGAIVHNDNTCRIQTVSKRNGFYFKLLTEFYRVSGIPCVLDTSFNLKGEPIVESPEQAVDDFLKTKMDELYIGSYKVTKK